MLCFRLRIEVSALVCCNGMVNAQQTNHFAWGGLTYCQTKATHMEMHIRRTSCYLAMLTITTLYC